MGLSLANEIRRCLVFYNKPTHPANIRRWVLQQRASLEIEAYEQSLETFNRVMRYMPDVETVYDNGTYYRQFKQTGKLHQLYIKITRVYAWLTINAKVLLTKRDSINGSIGTILSRFK